MWRADQVEATNRSAPDLAVMSESPGPSRSIAVFASCFDVFLAPRWRVRLMRFCREVRTLTIEALCAQIVDGRSTECDIKARSMSAIPFPVRRLVCAFGSCAVRGGGAAETPRHAPP